MLLSLFRICSTLAIAMAIGLAAYPALAQQNPAGPTKPKHGPTPQPIACGKRMAALDPGQTESFGFWMRARGPADQVSVQFSCKLDRKRTVVGLIYGSDQDKENPAKYAVYVLDLSLDPPPARLLREHLIEMPVVVVRPGGSMSLVFGETTSEKGQTFRSYRAIDLTTGRLQSLFSVPIDTSGLGCVTMRAAGLERVFISAGAALVDLGDNGPYGVEIEHEDTDCKTGRNEKRVDTFIAAPDGFEEFK